MTNIVRIRNYFKGLANKIIKCGTDRAYVNALLDAAKLDVDYRDLDLKGREARKALLILKNELGII